MIICTIGHERCIHSCHEHNITILVLVMHPVMQGLHNDYNNDPLNNCRSDGGENSVKSKHLWPQSTIRDVE